MVHPVTTSDNEWQRMSTSENEWQRVVQWVTTNDNEWRVIQRVTTSGSSGTTNENDTVHFKEWMIAVFSMAKTDTLLL